MSGGDGVVVDSAATPFRWSENKMRPRTGLESFWFSVGVRPPARELRIDICEGMLSPFATAANAHWMVERLRALHWPAVYRREGSRWVFDSYEQAAMFRRDFDEILGVAPFVWPVDVHENDGTVRRDWVATVAGVDADTVRPAPFGARECGG